MTMSSFGCFLGDCAPNICGECGCPREEHVWIELDELQALQALNSSTCPCDAVWVTTCTLYFVRERKEEKVEDPCDTDFMREIST